VSALVPRYEPLAPRLQELQAAGVTVQLRAETLKALANVTVWQDTLSHLAPALVEPRLPAKAKRVRGVHPNHIKKE
jgi:hypothetical protein